MHLAPVPEVPRSGVARSGVARSVPTPIGWQLTDRGIVVVLLVAAMILTAAVIAIGVTAVRVTSADYNAHLHGSSPTQR